MDSLLATLMAIEWKGFGDFAEEASPAALEARLARFEELLREAAGPGEIVDHPVKGRQELRVLTFPGPSAALQAVRDLAAPLAEGEFSVGIGLHAGECYSRSGGLLGGPIREVAGLGREAAADQVLLTEVFRLTTPRDTLGPHHKVDRVIELAGAAWAVWQLGEAGEAA